MHRSVREYSRTLLTWRFVIRHARSGTHRLALVAVLLAGTFLRASTLPAQDGRATVRLDGRPVFRVGAADSISARERAARIERRLVSLLETPRALASAQVQAAGASGADRVVTVAGVPVVTVSRADAEDNLTTTEGLAAQWARALDTALARATTTRLSTGGRFRAEVQGSVQTAFSRLIESAITIVPRVVAALLVIALFWLLATGARWIMRVLFRRVVEDLTVENLIKQVAYYAIWALGLMLAVDALGFQPQTVVTGLGLTGLALGFALKDIISNFVSGLLILALRPFELGDEIVVGNTEGNVERIELRATHIRTYGGRLVLVPNAELFTSRITNNTASPVRRASVTLYLGYDADLRHAAQVAVDAALGTAGVLAEPSPSVRIQALGQDDIAVDVRFWADSRRSDFVATQSAVRVALVHALRQAGIALPDPAVRHLMSRGSGSAVTPSIDIDAVRAEAR